MINALEKRGADGRKAAYKSAHEAYLATTRRRITWSGAPESYDLMVGKFTLDDVDFQTAFSGAKGDVAPNNVEIILDRFTRIEYGTRFPLCFPLPWVIARHEIVAEWGFATAAEAIHFWEMHWQYREEPDRRNTVAGMCGTRMHTAELAESGACIEATRHPLGWAWQVILHGWPPPVPDHWALPLLFRDPSQAAEFWEANIDGSYVADMGRTAEEL